MSIRFVLGSRASIGGVLGSGRGGGGNGLLTGLVAYWALDEVGGANNALDKHSGLTLTQANSPSAATGKVYATARAFNGTTQYFSRNSETALQTGDLSFAFAVWVYPTAADQNRWILSKDNSGTAGTREYSLLYRHAVQRFSFIVFKSIDSAVVCDAISHGAPSLNAWSLVVVWHDSSADTVNIQINNGTVDSVSTGGALQAASNARFYIGDVQFSPFPFLGRIGPVMFWKNRTLDATARAALYNGGAGLAYSAFS